MAENIDAEEFAGRMRLLASQASITAMVDRAAHMVETLNAFEPTRKALAYILGQERAKIPAANTIENGVPSITALQLLERLAFLTVAASRVSHSDPSIAALEEVAHLSQVAFGRAPIVPPKAEP
jgi:hypothetical protein